MPRYFWLLSDRKTIREISCDEYKELVKRDFNDPNKAYLKIVLFDSEIYVGHGNSFVNIPLMQLSTILREA